MRPSGSTRPIIFGFIFAIGITLTLPYLAFGAARSFGGSGRFRGSTIDRQHSFLRPFNRFGVVPFNGFGFLVWVESTSSQSSLFSSFSLRQSPNLEDLPQTEFTFSHAGWTAGMEYRSYSQDTGPMRSKRKSVDPRISPPIEGSAAQCGIKPQCITLESQAFQLNAESRLVTPPVSS